jgi:hypothetical protein
MLPLQAVQGALLAIGRWWGKWVKKMGRESFFKYCEVSDTKME